MTEKMEMVKLGFFSGGIELRLCEGMKLWFSIGRKKKTWKMIFYLLNL